MNIREYFIQRRQPQIDATAAARAELESMLASIKQKQAAISDNEKLLEERRGVLSVLNKEGMDSAKIAQQIVELESQNAALNVEVANLNAKVKEWVVPPAPDVTLEDKFCDLLEQNHKCTEAAVVERLEVLFGQWPVVVTKVVGEGHVAECKWCTPLGVATIPVKVSSEHFCVGFRPDDYSWVPTSQSDALDQDLKFSEWDAATKETFPKLPTVFFEKCSGRFILKDPIALGRTTKTRTVKRLRESSYYGGRATEVEVQEQYEADEFLEISGIAVDFKTQFLQAGQGKFSLGRSIDCSETLDLECEYSDNTLLAHVRSMLLSKTKPALDAAFAPTSEVLTSPEIFQLIKVDWQRLASCPWSQNTMGPLAMLKFSVENAEKARFMSTSYKHIYGYRLRTRDHDWLVGELYIAPDAPEPESRSAMDCEYNRDGTSYATLGRMTLTCAQSKI